MPLFGNGRGWLDKGDVTSCLLVKRDHKKRKGKALTSLYNSCLYFLSGHNHGGFSGS